MPTTANDLALSIAQCALFQIGMEDNICSSFLKKGTLKVFEKEGAVTWATRSLAHHVLSRLLLRHRKGRHHILSSFDEL